MVATAKDWLLQAEADLKAALDNITTKNFHISVQASQQAVEKGLKAIILQENNEIPKTHNLFTLAKKIKTPPHILDLCSKLNPIFHESRYPDATPQIPAKHFTKDKAEHFLNIAKEVTAWIQKQARP